MLSVAQAFWFGDSYAEDVFVNGGTYTEATIGEVNSLNPLFATTSSERVLSRLMFATMTTNDYSGHTGMGLAASVVPSENGKIWTPKGEVEAEIQLAEGGSAFVDTDPADSSVVPAVTADVFATGGSI